jgi:hypothetical protein
MEKHEAKLWIIGYLILVLGALTVVGYFVVKIDPFFHYHKPDTDTYHYTLNNQRSQNDGIVKHFDYDALITGTSMTENFKTSEMDEIFGTKSIKVPFSGGRYKEINDNVAVALAHNPNLKTIIRGLDMGMFFTDKDAARTDLGDFPTYLYDNSIFNDTKYIFNKDIIFKRVYPMLAESDNEGFQSGITSFDKYSNWMASYTFGIDTVCQNGVAQTEAGEPIHITDTECETVFGTVEQNIVALATLYPDVTFYYFFPPYSIIWWQSKVSDGTIYKQIEAERLIIEELLKYDNIRLYSFNTLTDITTDLNNYKDTTHYGSWVNSLMLRYMKDGKCLLTKDNYEDYLNEELLFYTTYDYSQISSQIDYENDYYAESMIYLSHYDITPIDVIDAYGDNMVLKLATIIDNQYDEKLGLQCIGRLSKDNESDVSVAEYIISTQDYVGAKFTIDDISEYKYLTWYGMKNQDNGQPSVCIYDENNNIWAELYLGYSDLDTEWHPYMIDVSDLSGKVTIIFNGGYVDNTGSNDSTYTFSDIKLF